MRRGGFPFLGLGIGFIGSELFHGLIGLFRVEQLLRAGPEIAVKQICCK